MSFVICFFFLLRDEILPQTTHSFPQQKKSQQKQSFFLFTLPIWEGVVFLIFLNTKRTNRTCISFQKWKRSQSADMPLI